MDKIMDLLNNEYATVVLSIAIAVLALILILVLIFGKKKTKTESVAKVPEDIKIDSNISNNVVVENVAPVTPAAPVMDDFKEEEPVIERREPEIFSTPIMPQMNEEIVSIPSKVEPEIITEPIQNVDPFQNVGATPNVLDTPEFNSYQKEAVSEPIIREIPEPVIPEVTPVKIETPAPVAPVNNFSDNNQFSSVFVGQPQKVEIPVQTPAQPQSQNSAPFDLPKLNTDEDDNFDPFNLNQ